MGEFTEESFVSKPDCCSSRGSPYTDSYYSATTNRCLDFPALSGHTSADVCVIGGGYTGLSSAIHLAQRGYAVVLLEAQRVGWGASGRNGGQCTIGQRHPQEELEARFGQEEARRLWALGVEAVELVRGLIARFAIECDLKRGCLVTAAKNSDAAWYRGHAEHMRAHYDFDLRFVEGGELRYLSGTDVFRGGVIEHQSAHLHPLNYALGLADAAHSLGVRIFEGSRVLSYDTNSPTRIRTKNGLVTARYVVLGCNGYLERLEPRIAGTIMPINNFIITTEPLAAERQKALNPLDVCMYDAKFVVN